MGKYIIHFDDKPWQDLDDELYYRCNEIPWFSTTRATISRLTPYTEPDMEQVRKEAYAEGYNEGMQLSIDDAKLKEEYRRGYKTAKHESENCPKQAYTDAIRMEGYQQGLSDAWEAARKIGSNSMCSLKEMGFDFSQCAVSDYNPSWFVVKNYSASEAIEKIRQYEQDEQEKDRQARIEYNFDEIGDVINTTMKECNVSLDEIAEVLQKMKEAE